MKRMLIAAVTAASMTLASCASMPTAAQVAPQVERAQKAYNRIAAAADVILPFLPAERAAQVRLAMALAERGLIAARYAATVAAQLAAQVIRKLACARHSLSCRRGHCRGRSYATRRHEQRAD